MQNFVNELDPEFVQAEGDEKEKEFYVSFYNLPYVAHHQKLPSLNSLTFLPGRASFQQPVELYSTQAPPKLVGFWVVFC